MFGYYIISILISWWLSMILNGNYPYITLCHYDYDIIITLIIHDYNYPYITLITITSAKSIRLPPDATEPSTGFTDRVAVLSPDTQNQAMAPSFSPGPKVTLTGATSKGVFAQGTVHQAKEGGAEVLFVTHFQAYAVHCGIGRSAEGIVGVTAILRPGTLPHVQLIESKAASEALIRVAEGLTQQRHALQSYLEGPQTAILNDPGFKLEQENWPGVLSGRLMTGLWIQETRPFVWNGCCWPSFHTPPCYSHIRNVQFPEQALFADCWPGSVEPKKIPSL